ncbi:ubiquitin domain-containing protein 1 [Lepeophtheirus salmonis]|uniref:Ubiquitin-like domain-containing protein n=1 Tax=Lepeophtheirus salmonis TaxID=72036 RepID=A0A0K2UW96_LEPSM|nr:ubiquitin domain-containing protein 1-like [Lepeophtheirus salmonis]
MGGCVGTARRNGRGHQHHRRPSGLSVAGESSTSLPPQQTHHHTSSNGITAKNRPLKHEKIRWKSDIPLTDGQLLSKREEFWDTAPAFEGKPEVWSALRAATEAAETAEDFELAQAILDGAGISIPQGSLVECYDELGTRYAIPVYCLSFPVNLVTEESSSKSEREPESETSPRSKESTEKDEEKRTNPSSSTSTSSSSSSSSGTEMKLKVRISLTSSSQDVKLFVNSESTVGNCKKKLQIQEKLKHSPSRQRWYYGGKLLHDKSKIGKFGIPSGYVVQCVLNNLDFDIIETKD